MLFRSGRFRGRDNLVHQTSGHNYYTVFSLWDTFRGEHPLLTITDRKRTSDFIKTFLLQYQQGGRLPVWELASNETDCMIGYHSASVISDAISKGIRDFDLQLALEAMKKSATWNHLGLPALMKKNYIEAEDEHDRREHREPEPRAVERDFLVDGPWMPWAEGQQHHHREHGPDQP